MKRLVLAAAAAAGLVMSLPAAAQWQKPEDAIKYRQSVLTVMANHFGRIGAMAQGKAPFDAKVAQENAEIALAMSKLPFVAFYEGTDKGMPNRAKPEIWSNNAKFKAAAEKMQGEMVKLEAATKSGNLDNIKAAVGAVGPACKACHDDFRAEKYSAN
jgi:cytochrome c556